MKSTEVYRTIDGIVGPWTNANGFTRAKSGWLAYQKPCAGKHLVFWFQCNRWGWDKYSGSSFVVEFQFHESPKLGQSSIIGKVPPPPKAWVDLFESNAREPYQPRHDIWMRDWAAEDVKAWAAFVLSVLSRAPAEISTE